MIAPEKLSKSLAKANLKIGINVNEFVALSFIPFIGKFLDFKDIYLVATAILIGFLLILKNKFLEKKYIRNYIEFEDHQEWSKVKISND